ncbi:FAD-dependent oxidoreductase [Propionibacteriaceae bacterium Y2011]
MSTAIHHDVVIVGGGNAGISVAARLRRAGVDDIGLIEPSERHFYQPLWTLVGGGCASAKSTFRPEAGVIPKGVAWIKDNADDIDPNERLVHTRSGAQVSYDHLVVAPGIQLDWDKVDGLPEALVTKDVSSNYSFDLAPRTWRNIAALRRGRAIFTMPSGPIKCAGAPQKIAYLAADYWRREGVLDAIEIVLVLPTPGMFGVPVFSQELERVVERYGINVRFSSEVTSIAADQRRVTVTDNTSKTTEDLGYDLLHVVPPQSAPDWLKQTPMAADVPQGWVEVGKHSMQHVRYPEVFSLGDACSTPNSKTGAAIRKQAPVLVENLIAARKGRTGSASYGGYASCPLTTARDKMLLAEFDYTMQPAPSIPLIDTTHERRDMWLLKKYGLPALYWNAILSGRA